MLLFCCSLKEQDYQRLLVVEENFIEANEVLKSYSYGLLSHFLYFLPYFLLFFFSPSKTPMILRRRYVYWLFKAYLKKWRKTIFISFAVGLAIFFVLRYTAIVYIPKIPLGKDEYIGLVGTHTVNNLPQFIVNDISMGLTTVLPDGKILPAASESWKIENDGRKYTFTLRSGLYFSDKAPLTSQSISYSFEQVKIEKPNKKTIVFVLKDSYAPFLITVSKPIFKKGNIGLGNFRIKNVKLNGNYIQSLTLVSNSNQYHKKNYYFYPTDESLKTAFILGEVSTIRGTTSDEYEGRKLSEFPKMQVTKYTNEDRLVTLFFNTKDPIISDEKFRNALTYSLPDSFKSGQRNGSPISTKSWAYSQNQYERHQDLKHALDLIETSESASKSGSTKIVLDTLPKYMETAKEIAKTWKKIGVDTEIIPKDQISDTYQVFLGDFRVPKDPDQYTLWHSNQQNNITGYRNLRIDKLLEDGRKTIDVKERKEIYDNFQKYLLDDSPAAFLYFPYVYDITRS